LIDDEVTDFGQPVDVCFTGAKVSAFDCVVEEAEDAVAIVLIIFGGVDSALRGDAVSAARAVLVTKAFNVVAKLSQRGRGRAAREPAPHHNDLKLPAVIRGNQAGVILVARPFVREPAGWDFGVQSSDHSYCAGFTR
jgi:hypothetical protein